MEFEGTARRFNKSCAETAVLKPRRPIQAAVSFVGLRPKEPQLRPWGKWPAPRRQHAKLKFH
jgi:hypothetical protein